MRTRRLRQLHTLRLYLLPGILFLGILAANVYIFRQYFGADASLMMSGEGTTQAASLPRNLLAPQEIKGLVKTEAPHATITKIELQNQRNKLIYVVSLGEKAQLVFDAQTGLRLGGEMSAVIREKNAPDSLAPRMDFASAGEQALSQKPGGTISKIDLEAKNGDPTYTVHFTDGSAVGVAADKPASTTNQSSSDSSSSTDTNGTADESPTTPSGSTDNTPATSSTSTGPASSDDDAETP